jgi:hypothetical protein
VENGHVVGVYLRISDPSQMPASDHVWEIIVAVYKCHPLVRWWDDAEPGKGFCLPISGTSANSFAARPRLSLIIEPMILHEQGGRFAFASREPEN